MTVDAFKAPSRVTRWLDSYLKYLAIYINENLPKLVRSFVKCQVNTQKITRDC